MEGKLLVFIGCLNREAPYFQGARGVGLQVYAFDESTLEIEKLVETDAIDNPSFLSVSEDGSHIYANSEVFVWREGLVTALSFDRRTKTLAHINAQTTLGSITAHNMITRDGTKLLVSNYAMGEGGPDQSLVVFGIRDDGGLTAPLSSVAHKGTGPNKERQERSHAHSFTELLSGGMAIAADLGLDQLITYRIGADGSLTRVAETAMPPGSGPRHIALHPNGRLVFSINELDSTISSLTLDAASGELSLIDTWPALPADAGVESHCAEVVLSPDGRFLYGSNRGHDSIVVYAVDAETGRLALQGHTPCGGATPRHIGLTPSGAHLFSANQNGDCVTIFARDAETGRLTDTGRVIETGTPMCVKFAT